MFRCSRKFSAGTTKKVMFHLLSNRVFRNLFVNGQQPVFRPRKPATGIKDGFEQMEHEFPFGIFRPMVLITWEIQKLWLENQIVRATPFVELQNPWSVT